MGKAENVQKRNLAPADCSVALRASTPMPDATFLAFEQNYRNQLRTGACEPSSSKLLLRGACSTQTYDPTQFDISASQLACDRNAGAWLISGFDADNSQLGTSYPILADSICARDASHQVDAQCYGDKTDAQDFLFPASVLEARAFEVPWFVNGQPFSISGQHLTIPQILRLCKDLANVCPSPKTTSGFAPATSTLPTTPDATVVSPTESKNNSTRDKILIGVIPTGLVLTSAGGATLVLLYYRHKKQGARPALPPQPTVQAVPTTPIAHGVTLGLPEVYNLLQSIVIERERQRIRFNNTPAPKAPAPVDPQIRALPSADSVQMTLV